MFKYKTIFAISFLSLLFPGCIFNNGSNIPLIPRKVLFGNPQKTRARISPDGQKLLYLAPVNNIRNIWVKTIGKNDDRPITTQQKRDIHAHVFWALDNNHIFYKQDNAGDENWHLLMVDINTKEKKDITPFKGAKVDAILAYRKQFPNEILFTMNKRDPKVFDVYKLNVKTGELKMVAQNPGNISHWLADFTNKVRAAKAAKPDGTYELLVRDDENSPWKMLTKFPYDDIMIAFSKDGSKVYVIDSRNTDKNQLVTMDIKTGKTTTIIQDAGYDIEGAIFSKENNKLQAVSIYKDKKNWVVLDDALKDDFARMQALDEGEMAVANQDNNEQKWIVAFNKDDAPLAYWLFDRDTKKGTFLFVDRPELEKYKLAKTEAVKFVSRDGLTIHGYLTCPVGKAKKNLPLILFVHGGPWVRDKWGYDSRVQWFANRGYAVLQVNYRGSTGYGKKFIKAGNKQWGGKMHDDLVDAVNWAVKKGIANPKKVAIFGGSYGGYAALVGATFTPDLFCCAVDIVGPSNLITLIKSFPPYWKIFLETIKKRVGDIETEQAFLKSCSPLFKADKIKIPLLIVQGANDPRVKKAEADQIVKALKKNKVDYEYLLFEDEGHGLVKEKNKLKFYKSAEKFFAKHLGGRSEG